MDCKEAVDAYSICTILQILSSQITSHTSAATLIRSPFQNHHAGFILTSDGVHIDGYGTGGINGNGDVWYTAEAGNTAGTAYAFRFLDCQRRDSEEFLR